MMVDYKTLRMKEIKKIALVAHDAMKQSLVEWCEFNKCSLDAHCLYATGTTGEILVEEVGLVINRLRSGPLGGDSQIAAMIAENEINMVIFFLDPLDSHPHDADIKALLRIAAVYNIPIACTRSGADFLISSPLMDEEYERIVVDYEKERDERESGNRAEE